MPLSVLFGLLVAYVRLLTLDGLRRSRKVGAEDGSTSQEQLRFSSVAHYEVSTRFVYELATRTEAEIEVTVAFFYENACLCVVCVCGCVSIWFESYLPRSWQRTSSSGASPPSLAACGSSSCTRRS